MDELAQLINERVAGAPLTRDEAAVADALIEALRPMMRALADVVAVLADRWVTS